MSRRVTERVLRTARAALLAQPSHGCSCWGEPQHRASCHIGKRDRAVEAIDRHLAQLRIGLP